MKLIKCLNTEIIWYKKKYNNLTITKVIAIAITLVIVVGSLNGCNGKVIGRQSVNTLASSELMTSSEEGNEIIDVSSNKEIDVDSIEPIDFPNKVTLCNVDENLEKYLPKIFDNIEMLNKCDTMTEYLMKTYVVDPGHVDISFSVLIKALHMQEISEEKQAKYYEKLGPYVYISKKTVDKIKNEYLCSSPENIICSDFGRVFTDGDDELYRIAITSYGGYIGTSFLINISQVQEKIIADFVHAYKKEQGNFLYTHDPWASSGEKRIANISSDGIITPVQDELNTSKKVRYTFYMKDKDVKLDSIRFVEE